MSHWLWCLIVVLASAISANSQAFWPNTLPSAFRRKQTKVLIQGQVTLGFSSWWQIVVCLRRKWRAHEKWHCSISSNLGTGKTWARRLILFFLERGVSVSCLLLTGLYIRAAAKFTDLESKQSSIRMVCLWCIETCTVMEAGRPCCRLQIASVFYFL